LKTGTNPYSWHYPTHKVGNKQRHNHCDDTQRCRCAVLSLCTVVRFLHTG